MVRSGTIFLSAFCFTVVVACTDGPGGTGAAPPTAELSCELDERYFVSGGVGRDVIPALTDPELVAASEVERFTYLAANDRVIGVFLDGEPVAVPHNILWHHEIMNLNGAQQQIAVSYCPLTGTSLVFDRGSVGGAEFGVSGLLFQANLIMYDRNNDDSLWPQMLAEARCGPKSGSPLQQVPMFEMTWAGWQQLYPQTKVVATPTGVVRNYTINGYPYGNYESESNQEFLGFPVPTPDLRLPAKARVFGIPGDAGGASLPFQELDDLGPFGVVEVEVDGVPLVVLWDRAKRAAGAFRRELDGAPITLAPSADGFQDEESGTTWSVTGEGVGGTHTGRSLVPVETTYVAFWGAWSNFNPDAVLWLAP